MATPNFVTTASKYYILAPSVPEVTEENAEELLEHYGFEREEFTYLDYDYEKDEEVEKIDLERLEEAIWEYETRDFWDWEIDEIKENIRADLKLLEKRKKTYQIYVDTDINEWSCYAGRGYELLKFARIELIVPVKYTKNGITAETSIHIFYEIGMRSGYYEGINLDWELEIGFGDSYETYDFYEFERKEIIERIVGDLEYEMDLMLPIGEYSTEKMKEEMRKRAENKYYYLENRMSEVEEFIEKIFEKYSVQYRKLAQFSNGEAIYQRI